MNDIFFDIHHIQDKSSFIRDCISKSYNVWCDELDCNVSFARKQVYKTPEDIIKYAEESSFKHYVFILRRSLQETPYIEASIRTGHDGIDYFLWINIKLDMLDYFQKKYHINKS
jgi:hypothetical protein